MSPVGPAPTMSIAVFVFSVLIFRWPNDVRAVFAKLKPPADSASILRVFIPMRFREKLFFQPHLNLNQHDTESKSKQCQSVWDHQKEPKQGNHHPKEDRISGKAEDS